MPVIDNMAVLAAGVGPSAAAHHQRRRTEKAFEPIVIQAHAQTMADQARRYGIEHFLESEPAGRGDADDRLFVIRSQSSRDKIAASKNGGTARIGTPEN